MTYVAPKLTRLGSVASLTASDIKCSTGQDFNYRNRWHHPVQPPFTHWTNGDQAKTAGELIRSGGCQWISLIQ